MKLVVPRAESTSTGAIDAEQPGFRKAATAVASASVNGERNPRTFEALAFDGARHRA